jgi:PAS domain-containing protein
MGGDGDTATVIEQARAEVERASRELERLTEQLNDRTELVERLEVLTDALLDLLPTPAVVVDAEGTLVAVSRGAAAEYPYLADALGRSAATVLPKIGGDDDDTDTVALPDGSRLLVLAS